MAKQTPQEIDVQGRRWRDSYGNTYHTVTIYVTKANGRMSEYVTVDPDYGHGDAYLATAQEVLIGAGVLPPTRESLWRQAERLGIDLNYEARNVKRKRDL